MKNYEILEKKGNLKPLYRNELDTACFASDVAYVNSKDLTNRTVSDKFLKDKAYEIGRNSKYDRYQEH